jgi:hypothetical protein
MVRSERAVSGSPTEDGVATRAYEAGNDQQHDAKDDLALEQLDDTHDSENDSDDPQ